MSVNSDGPFPPHPGPLPEGEGESQSAFARIGRVGRVCGLAKVAVAQETRTDMWRYLSKMPVFAGLLPVLFLTASVWGAQRPNFVFILADDLGWADSACYGSTFYETPNLDRLAAKGMRFTDAYAACSVC